MQAKDIGPRTWYATKEKYGYPDPVILAGTERYTVTGRFGHGSDKRVIFADPDQRVGSADRWSGTRTAYLAVVLTNAAKKTVQNWIRDNEGEQAAHDTMAEAATLLTKVVDLIAARGRVPMAEVDQPENREHGLHVQLIEGRELAGDYAEVVARKRDNENADQRTREASEQAAEQRRLALVELLDRATELGVNTNRFHGGARDAHSPYGSYSLIEMSVETFRSIVEEIERLRGLVAQTLRADEIGEGGTDAQS